jgi:manganese oxidase
VLRVLPGECLSIHFTNSLAGEPASIHLHDSSMVVSHGGGSATAANPAAMAAPGGSVDYEWMVPTDEPEGSRVFHSSGNERLQTDHGLFGTVVVEPRDATWTDPRTGSADEVGWDAVIHAPGQPDFREFVLMYHEVGDENYRIPSTEGQLPQVDPLTLAYRPGSRALNYRSEPFYDRLHLQSAGGALVDESLAYSSYAYGDPATPMERSYVGDNVKERVVHAGGEVFHVHHVHGGTVRWARQPNADSTDQIDGVEKAPPLLPGPSELTDSQTLGPSESFDVEHECSSGGCQQSAGDLLIHCHIAHHYFAGMWTIWRVYNTLQDGPASTDALPPLPALADRPGAIVPGVTSDQLGAGPRVRALASMPPAGQRKGYDASVFDWTTVDGRILGEPETTAVWPGYTSKQPGQRPAVLFDPASGRPAFPMLRPHLATRPPFAPGHGPTAFLDEPTPDGEPPAPGADGADSLCPATTTLESLSLRAVELSVPLNERDQLTDPKGTLFVLAEDEAKMLADPATRQPLALRANAGEDCLDVLLSNEIVDNADHPFSKVSAHIHFMQFDQQVSDGVDVGFNFEQTVRPFAVEGEQTISATGPADTHVTLGRADRFSVGAFVGVGMEDGTAIEIRRITAIDGGTLTLDRPLNKPHPANAVVSNEFVRYRWYPDVQVGTAYFHDHVNGLRTWQHGLVGAIVVEPPGSTYHDPVTGQPITSGVLADIHVPASEAVSADVSGSFREFVCFLQDPSQLTAVGRSPGANINLRAEPLSRRKGPVDELFSSATVGDPVTPRPEAYVGDPLMVRITVGGSNEIHTFHLDGHWFREEPWSTASAPINTTHVGISERKDVTVPAAGGPQQQPGDYLYSNGRALKLQEGAWGLLRVRAGPVTPALQPLPGHDPPTGPSPPVCPEGAPVREYRVAAVDAVLPMLGGDRGEVFVEATQADAVRAGSEPVRPLVLRADLGDCLKVTLLNTLPAGSDPVALHADGLAFDPADSGGLAIGTMPVQDVPVGGDRTYTFYAHPDFGTGAKMLRDGADLGHAGHRGLYGAIVVSPAGSTFDDPVGWSTVVHPPAGAAYRDAVVFMHDEDDAIGTHRMPYTTEVRGANALNYGTGTEIDAYAGDPLQLHVLAPWSEQAQVFTVEGHRWPLTPGMAGTSLVDSLAIAGLESIEVTPVGGAGGQAQLPGTYELGNHREPYREAGMTGTLVVHERCVPVTGLDPLRTDDPACQPAPPATTGVVPPSVAPSVAPTGSSSGSSSGGSSLWPWLVGAGVVAAGLALAAGLIVGSRRKD